ncbi:HTH_Tnp_Tc3_2 domain-containing protein [Trichonephila clavipes]|nr:HTH_Tnp_Tc3_2 domain-containing protein [Trichonephila clavipes]
MIMSDIFDVKRGIIIGVLLVGASLSRTANLAGVSKTTVLKVMTAYTNLVKMSSAKHNSRLNSKLKNRDRRVLKSLVTRKHKSALPQTTSEMNTHLQRAPYS